ncbi:MAG TPA: endo-1,4-beta-xylanase [bacterium]|nr:endo-1,4-beta-xylanase [bacterium]
MKLLYLTGFLGIALATTGCAQTTLKQAFQNDFLIGAALNPAQFCESNVAEAALVKRQFNSITPENVLKWEKIHPAPGQYDFTLADKYVAFGETNHMFIVGHTLIWHEQTPDWVFQNGDGKPVDRETLLARMRDHIFTIMGRYKGKIGGWDVVNEALDDKGRLRRSPWLKIIGEDFIQKAFEYAHEADPQAELYYNDFGLEKPDKRAGAIALIRKLQSQGVHITAVGVQGHYRMDWPPEEVLDETIGALGKLGVKVSITELDVDVLPPATPSRGADVSLNFALRAELNPYTNGLPDSVQQELAQRYAGLFKVFMKHRSEIDRVTLWGVTDENSWLNGWPVRGRTSYPLLFDRAGNPKPAFDAVVQSGRFAPSGG